MSDQPKLVYYADFVLAPLAVICLLSRAKPSAKLAALILLGLIGWTLIEYGLHRFTHWTRNRMHFRHHRFPLELAGPTTLTTAPLYLGIYILLLGISPSAATGLTSGLLIGLSVYLYTHAALHRLSIGPKHILAKAKARHDAHHSGSRGHYGVTTGVWDKLWSPRD
ncbi:MAG: sterol desaturase family protein [Bdellovibrionales bacterium]